MCDLISSTTYNHKKNHTSSHIYQFPGGDPWAERQHQPSTEPLPRVRAQGLEAVEEGQQPNGTLGWGLMTHHILCTSLSVGLFSNSGPDTYMGILFCEYSPQWEATEAQAEAGFRDVQSLLPSPPFPSLFWSQSPGSVVPNPGSLPKKRSLFFQRSCSHELLLGLWGDGQAPGWSLTSLSSSQRYSKKGCDAAARP